MENGIGYQNCNRLKHNVITTYVDLCIWNNVMCKISMQVEGKNKQKTKSTILVYLIENDQSCHLVTTMTEQ